jgi:outer membrane protein assembly factor BamB
LAAGERKLDRWELPGQHQSLRKEEPRMSRITRILASGLIIAPRNLSRWLCAGHFLLVVCTGTVCLWLASPLAIRAQAIPAPSDVHAAPPPAANGEQRFPGGAALKTDADQQRLLEQAERLAGESRFDLAATLWQKVIDEAGNTLSATKFIEPTGPSRSPLIVYRSLAEQVEDTLARLPPEGLAAYRTTADAEAKALLAAATPTNEEPALRKIVRRFFLSSLGDDAAFRLAGLALDRHDFVTASRLLNRILTRHPDSSVARSELLVRLAVAAGNLQDRAAAEAALAQVASASGPRPTTEVMELVAADLKQAFAASAGVAESGGYDWPLALGNPARVGKMPALPPTVTSTPRAEAWSVAFERPKPTESPRSGVVGDAALIHSPVIGAAAIGERKDVAAREELVAQWLTHAWRPSGSLRLADDRVYFRTAEHLVCYGARQPESKPLWQSAQASRYELDALSQQLTMLAAATGGSLPAPHTGRPRTPTEIQFFGDRVSPSLAVIEGVIYSLEFGRDESQDAAAAQSRLPRQDAPLVRGRRTRLTAYDAATGKALWKRRASDHEAEPKEAIHEAIHEAIDDAGFLAAPTPCGNLLLVPATRGGALELLGLDGASGKTLWRSYLCEEPAGGVSPWAEPLVAVEGQEAYLAAGCGVVFAIDAADGAVRWAVRYAREARPSAALRNLFGENSGTLLETSGWDDDVVIPFGRLVVVLPSDSDRLLALDRRTGERVWESPRVSPLGSVASYCLGVQDGSLFVAGKNVVRRYELLTGRLEAETPIDDSFGRGCLTVNAVYMPVKNAIVRLDLNLKQTATASVVLSTDEPVGNLFSDGRRLWVVGTARVYALESLAGQLTELAQAIAAGDSDALLKRMRIYLKQNQRSQALADLRSFFALLRRQNSAEQAAARLLAAMHELKLPQNEPVVTLKLLTELLANSPPPRTGEQASSPLTVALVASITALRQHQPPEAVDAILAAAPLLREEYLQGAATFAVDAVAKEADVPRLLAALKSNSAAAQQIALPATVRLAPDRAKPQLQQLLASADDRVRLHAARALANLGESQQVLQTLVGLLSSDNVAVRSRSQQTLEALTGQHIPFAPEGAAADRAATARAWRAWLAAHSTVTLKLPLADRAAAIGRTLLVTPAGLIELDAEHRERWRMRLPGAAWGCQGLPNGHRLVAINSHSMVIEYDDSGKEVWRKDRLPAPPTTIQRLENGHTLVACGHAQQVVEIAPDGSITSIPVPGNPISAQRLDSGNTLVALDQTPRVIEIDRAGNVVWEVRTGSSAPLHAVRLASGNTLVTLGPGRQVIELDAAGQTVWQTHVPLTNPFAAQRLPGGETLVADQTGVRAIDASGRQILWQHRAAQVTSVSVF